MNFLKAYRSDVLVCSILAKPKKYRYFKYAQQKAVGLALVGYLSLAHIVRFGLFLCVKSLCVRISMAKLERDTFTCAGNLMSQSTNPFQFCHPHLVVNGKAPIYKGAH